MNARNFQIKTVAILLVFVLASPAFAAEKYVEPPWRKTYDDAYKHQDCQGMWDVLWPAVKSGDVMARQILLWDRGVVGETAWADTLTAPGVHDDPLSDERETFALTVYAEGYLDMMFEFVNSLDSTKRDGAMEGYQYFVLVNRILYESFADKHPQYKEFYQCVYTTPLNSEKCAQIALDQNIIPSFEEYAARIDKAVAEGKKPYCEWNHSLPAFEQEQKTLGSKAK